jgi:hypothetical protein
VVYRGVERRILQAALWVSQLPRPHCSSLTRNLIPENCLIQSPLLGALRKPLSGLVFSFNHHSSSVSFRPCEAAYLAFPRSQFQNAIKQRIPVNVLVSPSNFIILKHTYEQIPGVTVRRLRLRPRDLNISNILTLMAVSDDNSSLYMAQVTKVLREMAEASHQFSYLQFKLEVGQLELNPTQRNLINARLDLLESFLDMSESANTASTAFEFAPGSITIVDLTCPFVDAGTACILFNIVLGAFLAHQDGAGKIIVVDEAHKFITGTEQSKVLTESLLTAIRLQRHYGARIIMATQEPTVDPRLMDLCSMTVIHRFTSPAWFSVLKGHIAKDWETDQNVFKKILELRTGEAIVYAPNSVYHGKTRLIGESLKIKMRKRVTCDVF